MVICTERGEVEARANVTRRGAAAARRRARRAPDLRARGTGATRRSRASRATRQRPDRALRRSEHVDRGQDLHLPGPRRAPRRRDDPAAGRRHRRRHARVGRSRRRDPDTLAQTPQSGTGRPRRESDDRRADRDRRPPPRAARAHGVLHRHDGLHRLQGVRGRVQAVERSARRRIRLRQGKIAGSHGLAVGEHLAPRAPRRDRAAARAGARSGAGRARRRRRRPAPEHPGRTGTATLPQQGEDVDLVALADGGALPEAGMDRWLFASDVCKHCANAGCLDACPTGALVRTEFETVIVQPDVCNGCGYCVTACPFGVIDRDPTTGARPSARSATTACRTAWSPPVPRRARPTPSSSVPTRSSSSGPRGACRAARARPGYGVSVRRRRRGSGSARRRPGRVLPAHRAARALRPARARRLPDPGQHARRTAAGLAAGVTAAGDGRRLAADRPPQEAAMSHGHGPPPEQRILERGQRRVDGRDMTPAVGRRGEPGGWRRAVEGSAVRGFKPRFADGRWSFLYRDTRYAPDADATATWRQPPRAMRGGRDVPVAVKGPVIRPPTCGPGRCPSTSGSAGWPPARRSPRSPAMLARDERSAGSARIVAIGAAGAGGAAADHGPRPARSASCTCSASSRPARRCRWAPGACRLLALRRRRRRRRPARAAPRGARPDRRHRRVRHLPRLVHGRTARLHRRARMGSQPPLPRDRSSSAPPRERRRGDAAGARRHGHGARASHPRRALAALETAAMAAELALSAANERRLGIARRALEHGRPGRLLKAARALTAGGLALRLARPARRPPSPTSCPAPSSSPPRWHTASAGSPPGAPPRSTTRRSRELARRPQASARPA